MTTRLKKNRNKKHLSNKVSIAPTIPSPTTNHSPYIPPQQPTSPLLLPHPSPSTALHHHLTPTAASSPSSSLNNRATPPFFQFATDPSPFSPSAVSTNSFNHHSHHQHHLFRHQLSTSTDFDPTVDSILIHFLTRLEEKV